MEQRQLTPEQLKIRGENAARLLNDPVMQEAFSIIERDIFEMWVVCPERDIEGKNLLQQHIRNARKLRDILHGIMQSGKMENFLEKKQSPFEKYTAPFSRAMRGDNTSRR